MKPEHVTELLHLAKIGLFALIGFGVVAVILVVVAAYFLSKLFNEV